MALLHFLQHDVFSEAHRGHTTKTACEPHPRQLWSMSLGKPPPPRPPGTLSLQGFPWA